MQRLRYGHRCDYITPCKQITKPGPPRGELITIHIQRQLYTINPIPCLSVEKKGPILSELVSSRVDGAEAACARLPLLPWSRKQGCEKERPFWSRANGSGKLALIFWSIDRERSGHLGQRRGDR